ncbi:high mobility group protein B2 [Patella vulgata]|uniref:high mobility group protein B2 n=1 Tax=Patella vulgata TaxID=6465 RepID=UPI00217F83C1|nr:high mobility group protein B2 [Patella vulgata]
MGRRGDSGKPRGRMSSYAFFVQTCREEHKKKHPGEGVVFVEFTKKCASKWKEMTPKEKLRFEDMAAKDKVRYEKEMQTYAPTGTEAGKKRRGKKDPNAPKRALSAFFFFCNEERPKVKAVYPNYTIGEVAKELGKRWEHVKEKRKYEEMTEKDKIRYQKEMEIYKGGATPAKKSRPAPPKEEKVVVEEDDDDEEEDDDDEEDEDDE